MQKRFQRRNPSVKGRSKRHGRCQARARAQSGRVYREQAFPLCVPAAAAKEAQRGFRRSAAPRQALCEALRSLAGGVTGSRHH